MNKAEGLQITADEQANLPSNEAGSSATIEKRLATLEAHLVNLEPRAPDDRVSIVVFSGEMDRVADFRTAPEGD